MVIQLCPPEKSNVCVKCVLVLHLILTASYGLGPRAALDGLQAAGELLKMTLEGGLKSIIPRPGMGAIFSNYKSDVQFYVVQSVIAQKQLFWLGFFDLYYESTVHLFVHMNWFN